MPGTSSSASWRTYGKASEIVIPAKTFVFIDEHPASINDGAFACTCTYNQSSDSPGDARLIDMPGNWHNGGCTLSFADSHVEIHRWRSSYLRFLATSDGYVAPLNISMSFTPLGYLDTQWLAEMTTVRK